MPRTPVRTAPSKTVRATPSKALQNGIAIRAFREKEGKSVQWLADMADVTAPHMRNIENEHRNASTRHLNLIAKALGIPVAAIQRESAADLEAAS